jgi:hypothetical protein
MPAFHALLPVRDEADIIGECLDSLMQWADAIHVFDTGSVDNTWEIVKERACREPRIKPLKKENVYYSENLLRGWLFHQARQSMREGDWFIRVDADEFHHVPPPEFVKTRLRRHETIVWLQYYNFCLRQSEVPALSSPEAVRAERRHPIEERRRWYVPISYSEPRLCRYRATMKWPATVSFPYNAGFVARSRLPIRHYPHRDPVQLERRCLLRAAMHADPTRTIGSFDHWGVQDWREFVTPDDALGLQCWKPGEDLPELHHLNHLAPLHKRVLQRVVHQFLLAYLDQRRFDWRADQDYPPRIPEDTVARLKSVLGAAG